MRQTLCQRIVTAFGTAAVLSVASIVAIVSSPSAQGDPYLPCVEPCLRPDSEVIRPFPPVIPSATNWVPKYPFPFDQTKSRVTGADITAERELCQWFNAQDRPLEDQIDRVQFNRIQQSGPGVRIGSGTDWDFSAGDVQQQVDVVTTNIDQAVGFIAPRAQALTQSQDMAGDIYFPIYQGESFYRLWQQLSNMNDGIKAHQPDWFTGPSVQRFKYWSSRIHRSGVCN